MDTQLKKGILDACILACLNKNESYGYQLLKTISNVVEVSESTLYPILRRLEKAECLTTHSMEYDGRLRKYYKITDKGKDKLNEFVEELEFVTSIFDFIRRQI
jgi:PadR family transcriptional regulator PadR